MLDRGSTHLACCKPDDLCAMEGLELSGTMMLVDNREQSRIESYMHKHRYFCTQVKVGTWPAMLEEEYAQTQNTQGFPPDPNGNQASRQRQNDQ
jgi:hypothetical protein